ncbi:probable receptor-like protein kinase At1g11050 [Ziziphus jujuba]|uniref:Probable receptor-like protein kinase At1g11050 n=1 Tax=Ziziphus jujuba TaxID=326968 RepID=A0ABM3INY9_ZIZJJ|nr:probable receptor-like protein kinase At1g11050 [Ziziphus jujuba]
MSPHHFAFDTMRMFLSLSFSLFLIILVFSIDSASSSSCPFDLGYVDTFPWDTSLCRRPVHKDCCQTLINLFGLGMAQHLNETSMFQLPDADTSSSCLSDFQTKVTALSVQLSLVTQCFQNTTQLFVVNPSSCAGIITIEDWKQKVGLTSPLDISCKGDLMRLTRCSSCVDAGMKVTSQLNGLDPNGTKCFYFTVLYAAGIVNDLGPQDPRAAACIMDLPLSRSSKGKPSNTTLKLVFGLLGALIGVLLFLGVFILYRRWDKKRRQKAFHEEYVSNFRASVLPNSEAEWFRLSELERATNGFSQRNLIGQGAHGVVYKGTLSDGTLVAVKQILDLDSKGDEEFSNEVEIMSKIRHRNLLSLRGCCVTSNDFTGKRRYLVYDFMSNGSLSDHLPNTLGSTKQGSKKPLTWPQRKNIILDVAKGLAYLHYGIKPAIYHRDIKATNIFLDSEMKAKVADFGLAKQSTEGQSHLTTRVAGTHGYLAPEYALYGHLTEKSDVYSFGILILEIMSGRKVLEASLNQSVVRITDWAWMLMKSGKVGEIVEEWLRESGGPKGVMERFVFVGILCAHVMVALRPTMDEALKMLEGDIDIPRIADRPLPLGHESLRSSFGFGSASISSTGKRSRSLLNSSVRYS